MWTEQGTYVIKVKAKDELGFESGWTQLAVTVPRDRALTIQSLLRLLISHFPILEFLLLR